MSMEFFNRIDSLKKYFLDFAEDHYNVALNIFEDQVTFVKFSIIW